MKLRTLGLLLAAALAAATLATGCSGGGPGRASTTAADTAGGYGDGSAQGASAASADLSHSVPDVGLISRTLVKPGSAAEWRMLKDQATSGDELKVDCLPGSPIAHAGYARSFALQLPDGVQGEADVHVDRFSQQLYAMATILDRRKPEYQQCLLQRDQRELEGTGATDVQPARMVSVTPADADPLRLQLDRDEDYTFGGRTCTEHRTTDYQVDGPDLIVVSASTCGAPFDQSQIDQLALQVLSLHRQSQ